MTAFIQLKRCHQAGKLLTIFNHEAITISKGFMNKKKKNTECLFTMVFLYLNIYLTPFLYAQHPFTYQSVMLQV